MNPIPKRTSRARRGLAVAVVLCGIGTAANAALLGGLFDALLSPLIAVTQSILTVDYAAIKSGQVTASHGTTCRVTDRMLGIERKSYGADAARTRQKLNDCTPELLFTPPAVPVP